MGILDGFANAAATKMLNGLRDSVLNPQLEGIGRITTLRYENKRLYVTIVLNGLEDREIQASCSKIAIAQGGGSVTLGGFETNMPFMSTIFERHIDGKPIPLPEGTARTAAAAAKAVLGL